MREEKQRDDERVDRESQEPLQTEISEDFMEFPPNDDLDASFGSDKLYVPQPFFSNDGQ